MSRILIVDDKEMMRDSVATTISRKNHTAVSAGSGKDAIEKIASKSFDAVITDLQMPEMNGLELLEAIRKIDDQLPVIFMTAYGTVETAVSAMKQGAYDYITKPFSGDELLVAVERAIAHSKLLRENQILRASNSTPSRKNNDHTPTHALVGASHAMDELRERLARLADSHGTVLISGESGSGKEVAARCVHEMSPRADKPFLAINCAALSSNLLESELFGHEKGAFTGADKLRKGRFELADGGTLLLDEISEISPGLQAKLLRVLQEQCFERVGSSTSRTVDVRVIATTNRDLPKEVEKGTFREDLYFRLNVLPLRMPALREHREDVPQLVEHFLTEVASREGKPVKQMDEQAMALLQSYDWPGNVRELQNICERAAVLTPDERIDASLLSPWLRLPDRGAPEEEQTFAAVRPGAMIEVMPERNGHASPAKLVCDGDTTLEDVERDVIIATLKHHNGHRQRSAKALGIGLRTLGLKLKKWKEQRLVAESL